MNVLPALLITFARSFLQNKIAGKTSYPPFVKKIIMQARISGTSPAVCHFVSLPKIMSESPIKARRITKMITRAFMFTYGYI